MTNMPDRPTVWFIYNVIRDRNYSREDYIMKEVEEKGGGSPRHHTEDFVDRLCPFDQHYSR